MFGEAGKDGDELVKPGMTKRDLEEIEKRGVGDGPDPFGDVFNNTDIKDGAPPEGEGGPPKRAPLPDQDQVAVEAGVRKEDSRPQMDPNFVPPPGTYFNGTMMADKGKYGFVRQDGSDVNMFILPGSCPHFGRMLPPEGTRLTYTVIPDPKTGRPRVDQAYPI